MAEYISQGVVAAALQQYILPARCEIFVGLQQDHPPPPPSQSSPLPYYTFYYDTGFSDEEELEEQVLRNTVNSEALMTAFHLNQTGTNGTKVQSRVPRHLKMRYDNKELNKKSACAAVPEPRAAEGAAVGGPLLGIRPRRAHVPHGEDAEARRHGDPGVAAGGAVDGAVW